MKKLIPIFIFIAIYLTYSLISYRSFGITWDEQAVYERGKMLYDYFTIPGDSSAKQLTQKQSPQDIWPTYNNSYAAVLYALNPQQSYEAYHLLNLLFATVLFAAAYVFLYAVYKHLWLSLLGPLFIVAMPRLFGDIAANPKDMPFAVLFFISIVFMYMLRLKHNILFKIVILGILFGFTQSLRTIGFCLYPLLFLYDTYQWRYAKDARRKKLGVFLLHEVLYIFAVLLISHIPMLLTWPYVAQNYFKNLIDVFQVAKKFPWDGTVFYMGKMYESKNLPLSYLPIWILISTPLFILGSLVGLVALFPKKIFGNGASALSVSVICINLLVYFLLKPVIYNGIRHYLFILPFFSILAAVFCIELFLSKYRRLKIIVFFILIINICSVMWTQAALFPYQYIYFNEAVGGLRGASNNFDTDYWAASTLESVKWLGNHLGNSKKVSTVYMCGLPLTTLNYFSPKMNWVGAADGADYSICPAIGDEYKKVGGHVIYRVVRDSVPLSYVIEK